MFVLLRRRRSSWLCLLAVLLFPQVSAGSEEFPAHPVLSPIAPGLVPDSGADSGSVYTVLEWDDGAGPALYAAGYFQSMGERQAWSLARRVDGHWWPMPWPQEEGNTHRPTIRSLAEWRGRLYASGYFLREGREVAGVALWDGQQFLPLPTPVLRSAPQLVALTDRLAFVGAEPFDVSTPSRLGFWDGGELRMVEDSTWQVSDGATLHQGQLHALISQRDAEGNFLTRVARWVDGERVLLPGEIRQGPRALVSGGAELYVVGNARLSVDGLEGNGVFRWDGERWIALSGGRPNDIQVAAFAGGRLYATRQVGCWGASTCSYVTDVWANGVALAPRFDGVGSATRIFATSYGPLFGGGFRYGQDDEQGMGSSALFLASEPAGLRRFSPGPSGWASSYADTSEGAVMGTYLKSVGDQRINCVARWQAGRWQPIGNGLPTCGGELEWAVESLLQTDEGLWAAAATPQTRGALWLWDGLAWSEQPLPEVPQRHASLFQFEGKVFAASNSRLYERVARAWQRVPDDTYGAARQIVRLGSDLYTLGQAPQNVDNIRHGLWRKSPAGWQFLGAATSMAVHEGHLYAAFSRRVQRLGAAGWEVVHEGESWTEVAELGTALLVSRDWELLLTEAGRTHSLGRCSVASAVGAIRSANLILVPGGGSDASYRSCAFGPAHATAISSMRAEPSRPEPGQAFQIVVEVTSSVAPTGGTVDVMGTPAGGCVVRNLQPISPGTSRGSCTAVYTRPMSVEIVAHYSGHTDGAGAAWGHSRSESWIFSTARGCSRNGANRCRGRTASAQ